MPDSSLCLCGSLLESDRCCALFHSGAKSAATAEQLMRSRFTAYAQHNEAYLLATWDSNKRPDTIDFSKEDNVEWTRLEIVGKKKGGEKDSKGIVEFKAYYLMDGEEYAMHEISRFVKKEGKWLYLDGMVKSVGKVSQQVNQGKNAPCPCGSGKKFKRCCGKA
ncbi:YchJ family protein [Methylomarinum vadi]|uniref:YchJ family protein n=1 Tax=Methylomarinum vadi TaxID=438855 RepID=UPI0004DF7901|nr:YchJ family protein [Methylomarinum vadi]